MPSPPNALLKSEQSTATGVPAGSGVLAHSTSWSAGRMSSAPRWRETISRCFFGETRLSGRSPFARALTSVVPCSTTPPSRNLVCRRAQTPILPANSPSTNSPHVRERVTDGTTLSGPLAAGGVFPKMMTDLLAIGEQTGDMPSALGNIGRRYESEMDKNIKVFTAALEPILIVFVAAFVGFIAISILSAVFKVSSGIGGA